MEEYSDLERKVDAKIKAFHKELTSRIEEIESLEMLLEAEMLQLKELVVGSTDIFFPKELEKRVSLIEEYLANMKAGLPEELEKQIRDLQDKIRALYKSPAIGQELKDLVEEAEKKIEALRSLKQGKEDSKALKEIEERVERIEKLLTKRQDDLEERIVNIEEAIEKINLEQMEDRIAERIEERQIQALRAEIDSIHERLKHVEMAADPANLVALKRMLEEKMSELEEKIAEAEKDVAAARMVAEDVKDAKHMLADFSQNWENLERALKEAEEAKRAAVSMRESVRAEVEAALMNRLDDAVRALDHKIEMASSNALKARDMLDKMKAELELLRAEMPALKTDVKAVAAMLSGLESMKKELEKAVEEARKKMDEIRSNLEEGLDRRIVMHLHGVMEELDKKMPEVPAKKEVEQLKEKVELLESVVKRLDLAGVAQTLRRLEERVEDLAKEIKKPRPRSFPLMIE